MTDIQPGWYKDPADPSTQRYWDGEGWIGDPIPADVDPPSGPPPVAVAAPPAPPVTTPQPGPVPHPAWPGWPGGPAPGWPGYPPSGSHPAGPQAPGPQAPGPQAPGPQGPVPQGWQGPSGPQGWPGGPQGWPGGPPGPQAPQGWPGQGGLPPGYPPGLLIPPGLARPPVSTPAGFVIASPGTRFAARIIDVLAVLVLCAAANWLFAYHWWQLFWTYANQVSQQSQSGGGAVPTAPSQLYNLTLIILVVTTAVWFAYEVPSSANTGQTLGKRLLGIRVMRLESEERLGFGRSWRRWSRLGLPTLLWGCCLVGMVFQFFDCFSVALDVPLHQALHDKAAATVVVRTSRRQP